MAAVDLQAVIALSPAEVYATLVNLAVRPSLDPTIAEITPPDGASIVGATFSGRGTASGEERGFEGVIIAAEPEQIFGLGLTATNGARLVEEIRLSPVPSGTLLAYHAELRLPGGLFGKLLDRLFVSGGFQKQRQGVLASMKDALERRAADQ